MRKLSILLLTILTACGGGSPHHPSEPPKTLFVTDSFGWGGQPEARGYSIYIPNAIRLPYNAEGSLFNVHLIDSGTIDNYEFDRAFVNCGLWDIRVSPQTPTQYEANLRYIFEYYGDTLIWCQSSYPSPALDDPEWVESVTLYNSVSLALCYEYDIPVFDPNVYDYEWHDDYHITNASAQMLASEINNFILTINTQ